MPSAKSIAASMWADEEKIFLMDESGKTFVIKSGPEFKILLENELDDLFWATFSKISIILKKHYGKEC